jgi:hypothetical protein
MDQPDPCREKAIHSSVTNSRTGGTRFKGANSSELPSAASSIDQIINALPAIDLSLEDLLTGTQPVLTRGRALPNL